MLGRIGSKELTEWQAFYLIEPFGEKRADYRMAILASILANINRDRKKRPRAYKAEEFLPKFGPQETERKSSGELLKVAKAINALLGGTTKKK